MASRIVWFDIPGLDGAGKGGAAAPILVFGSIVAYGAIRLGEAAFGEMKKSWDEAGEEIEREERAKRRKVKARKKASAKKKTSKVKAKPGPKPGAKKKPGRKKAVRA